MIVQSGYLLKGKMKNTFIQKTSKEHEKCNLLDCKAQHLLLRVCHGVRCLFFESLLTSFELSIIFKGSCVNSENRLEPKNFQHKQVLACPNPLQAMCGFKNCHTQDKIESDNQSGCLPSSRKLRETDDLLVFEWTVCCCTEVRRRIHPCPCSAGNPPDGCC